MKDSIFSLRALCAFAIFSAAQLGMARTAYSAEVIGEFRNTFYYVVPESEYLNEPVMTRVYGMQDEIIARVSIAFKKAVDIEGTGRLRDGRVINFAGRKNGEIRYHVTDWKWGHGVRNCALVPFHTIAVDPTRIPLGSLVQIDETVGMTLPDGSKHDGLWRAEDVGSAIQKDRIDLFVGDGKGNGQYLEAVGITNLSPLTVRMVAPADADSCVYGNQ